MRHDVVALGNALVDLQARVPASLLDRLGLERGFMTLVDEGRQRAVLEALRDVEVVASSGGSAANTIAGVAEMGGRAAYACKVGDDEHGEFYLEDLRRLGVTVSGERRGEGPTGTCVVLITPDAQRTMMTHLGISSSLAPEDVDAELVASASWLYVEGYLLPGSPTREAALAAIDVARRRGVKVALTVSDPFVVHAAQDVLWRLLDDGVDLLFCNEAESAALTGADDPIESAHALHGRTRGVIALTLGAKGSLLIHDGVVHPVEGVRCDAVDTTGAGDMYAAGILHGLTHGLSWPQAGRLASHAAARVVSHLGARLPQRFTDEEMRQLAAPVPPR